MTRAWLRARMSTLVRYMCNDSHRRRMLAFLQDPDESVAIPVIQGLGHLSFSPTCDQEVRASLAREWSARERAKLYVLGMTGSPGLAPIAGAEGLPRWQRSAARWWLDQGAARAGLTRQACWSSTAGADSAHRCSQSPIGLRPSRVSASWPSTE